MTARSAIESPWPPRLALLAGGLATRLRPVTDTLPKSLVPIAGEPFLAHQLRRFRANGLREIVICTGHLGNQIEDFAGDGSGFGLEIAYSHDGNQPLGTGGALRSALPLLGSSFLATCGDSWLTEPIEPVWRAFLHCAKPALMTVFRNNNKWAASNVDFREGAVLRYDKTHASPGLQYIDYGLEALDASVIANRIAPSFDLSEVWSGLAEYGLLAGLETAKRFYEIGTIPGLRETEAYLIANRSSASRNKITTPRKILKGKRL